LIKNLVFFFSILILSTILATSFENHQANGFQDNRSKISIKVSYLNDTSKSYEIFTDNSQEFTISQKYSWSVNNDTRFNLISYSIDNEPFAIIHRASGGNFTLKLETNSNHSIVFSAMPQFKIITDGIDKVDFLPSSPTNDNWFDVGSDVKIVTPYMIQSDQDNMRKQLSGWSLDSPDINVITRQESGIYKSPVIHMSSTHRIFLEYTVQYHINVISNFGRALGTGWYDSGTIATVSVIPGDGILVKHFFTGWQGSSIGSGDQESVNILLDSPKTLVANWFVDYTNVSIIGIIIIASLVSFAIYWKRRQFKSG
jgi:hypothetical protein